MTGSEHAGVLEQRASAAASGMSSAVLEQRLQLFWWLPARGHGNRLEHEAVTLDDREGGIEVQVATVLGGHPGEGLRVGRGVEAPE